MIGVIGDIILDKYTYTSSTRYSPECHTAPVGVIYDILYSLGGAANVAFNVLKLQESVKLYGACSDKTTLELIHANKIPAHLVTTPAKVVKNRIYVNNSYSIRVDEESTLTHDSASLLDKLSQDSISTLIISDYNKGTIQNFHSIQKSVNRARTIVDAKRDFDKYKGAFIIKPNIHEYYSAVGLHQYDNVESNIDRILSTETANELVDSLDIAYMVITAGRFGAIVVSNDKTELIPTIDVPVVDVTGAGDSFIAALAIEIDSGKTIREAVTFANRVAAISVTKRGTGYVNRYEI